MRNSKAYTMKTTFIFIILLVFTGNIFGQEITSGKKKYSISSTPQLVINKVELVDENKNLVAEANENCYFEITIKNAGIGVAKSVKVSTSIAKGNSPGLSFDESVYVGKIPGGTQQKVKVQFSTGISISEEIIKFKFEAHDANAYKSAPITFDLNLKAKEQNINLAVSWYYPIGANTLVDESKFLLKACIVSTSPIKEVRLFNNDQLLANERGMILLKSDDCDYTIEKEITLNEGH